MALFIHISKMWMRLGIMREKSLSKKKKIEEENFIIYCILYICTHSNKALAHAGRHRNR